jgi:transposase
MCEDAGVKSDFLAPYTPRINPIEEFFGEVKTHVKSQRKSHKSLIQRDFEGYPLRCGQLCTSMINYTAKLQRIRGPKSKIWTI